MDALFGIVTIVLFLISLFSAAIMDVRTGEVPNRVWFIGLAALPFGFFRLLMSGLALLYSLQLFLVFTLVIFCFSVGLLGGADGKALLVSSTVYPWLEINQVTLVYSTILIFTGAFLIVGIQCVILLFQNIIGHYQYSPQQRSLFKSSLRRYWFTRRISDNSTEIGERLWRKVAVPLVLYFLLTYLAMLFLKILC